MKKQEKMKKSDKRKSEVLEVISEIYKEDIDSELKDKLLRVFTDYVTSEDEKIRKYITKKDDINKILSLMRTLDTMDKEKLAESNEKVKNFFDFIKKTKDKFVEDLKSEEESFNPETLEKIGVTLPNSNNIDEVKMP